MTIRMIATDMDGTFLDDKGAYDKERFGQLLDRLDECGIRFVVATGNHMGRLSVMFEGFLDRIDIVADNGAHLVRNGKTLLHHTLSKQDLQSFLDYYGDKLIDYCANLTGLESSYMLKASNFEPIHGMIDPKELEALFAGLTLLESFADLPEGEEVVNVSMLVPVEDSRAIMDDFNANFAGNITATVSGFGAIDFIQSGIHKAWGLKQLMELDKLTADQVMTFGDSGNDLEMLALTANSYAVANASDEAKAAASHLAPHHAEQGVFQVIEAYLSQE